MHIRKVWPWLRTKIAHGKLAYQRGKSWGGETIILLVLGTLLYTQDIASSVYVFIISIFVFTLVGHIDRRYLKLWQEETKQGTELNPLFMEMYNNVNEIRALLLRRNTHK